MSSSTAARVVCASGAVCELILISIRVRSFFLTVTRDVAPRAIANPPPRAPILAGSPIGLPAASWSQTSKKLDMPAGQKAAETGMKFRS
jgi:hypothetical protein